MAKEAQYNVQSEANNKKDKVCLVALGCLNARVMKPYQPPPDPGVSSIWV
jgi:hypothetical protein